MQLKSKLPASGTTIFTIMSALANEHQAINLSQGFPNFNCHEKLQSLVNEAIATGYNQYAPMAGVPALRQALAQKYQNWLQVGWNPETEITVTTGATEALYCAITATVHPGNEVIVIEPCYDSYVPCILLNGGIPVYYTLSPTNHYKINWQELAQLLSPKTRAIIINNPHNPTGMVWEQNDINELANLVANTNIIVIADEVYEHIVFKPMSHISVMSHAGLKNRCIICGSFGKTYHTTGWKIGYCFANETISRELRQVHQWVTFSVNTPIQMALSAFIKEPEHYLKLPEFYAKKRQVFLNSITNSRFKVLPSSGSFFQSLDYSNISNEVDLDLAVRLTQEIKVAAIPLSAFYHKSNPHKILRFCFAKDDEMLIEAGRRLSTL